MNSGADFPTSHAPEQFAPRFWLLWGSQALSLTGSFAVQFALIWWLTATTGSATMLATAAMIGLLPQVVLGPLFGAMVDRWHRKLILFWSDTTIAIASAWLAWQFAMDAASVTDVLLILGVRAIGAAFHAPAMTATTSLMVPAAHYARIQGLNQAMQGGAPLIAAPLGALFVQTLSMSSTLLIDVATALVAVIPLLFVNIPKPPRDHSAAASLFAEFASGLRLLRQNRLLLQLVMAATFVNFCLFPAFSLLPLYVIEVLERDAWFLSWLQIGFGAGGILGGSVLAAWGGFKRQQLTVLTGFFLLGAATAVMGILGAGAMLVPIFAVLAVGAGAAIVNGSVTALLQALVPADMQGRVLTLLASIAGAATPAAMLVATPVAELFGLRWWYLGGGIACGIFAVIAVTRGDFGYTSEPNEPPDRQSKSSRPDPAPGNPRRP